MTFKQISSQHAHFDRFVVEWTNQHTRQGRSIHCRKGCSGCCHLAVHATFPETISIAANLSVSCKSKLKNYINRLTGILPELRELKDYLKRHRQELGPCPFLGETGECSIYSTRPLSCRALLSTRPAEWCTVDFSELTEWDKQAYKTGMDRQIVAWPTHFVAATQDLGQKLEQDLLDSMRHDLGWSLSGNFAVMVWLEHSLQLSTMATQTEQVHEQLTSSGLGHRFLLDFSSEPTTAPAPIQP